MFSLRVVVQSVGRLRPLARRGTEFYRALSSDKKSDFGDIMIEYEPYRDNTEFNVPSYPQRHNESESKLKARLLWQSRKRGIAENCLILSTYFAENCDKMSRAELDEYDKMINMVDNDWDLYYWITEKEQPPPPFDTQVLKKIQEFAKNKDMKDRTQQPKLK